ncbi:NAD(P)-dependent oxidoreductase [Opitutaceae bacterium TAV4]|nr:NAD(P)-dependent oxidoreductase [Opitutaceae bacterium TAV4]RRJ94488.1 NAD(P)-dependent oxidoreductase [Opitutaceae bacterium TAV4]RRJ98549.1 NAD(P)-dependent oxidoreductase [Opitutaceae bacterium TAV3]
MKNSIIFGGEGFIGRHLAARLLCDGLQVTSVDLAESDRREGAERRFVAGNVRGELKTESLELTANSSSQLTAHSSQLIAHSSQLPPTIFNLAAVHRTPGHPNRDYFDANLNGAENVCNFARWTGARTIIFTSSIAPYGASEDLKTEDTLPTPNTAYGISKLVAEHIHRTWQAEKPNERRLVIVRPGVVFGHGERGNVTRLYWALRRKRFAYPGRTDTIKASIYVKDVAALLAEMAVRPEPGAFIYNLTYEPAPTITDICATMSKVTGVRLPKLVIPGFLLRAIAAALGPVHGVLGEGFHPDRVRKLMISTNISGKKLQKDGYTLKYSLEDAIADWWKDCGERGLE